METVYEDAVQRVRDLQSSGSLSAEHLELIENTTNLDEFLRTIHSKVNAESSPKSSQLMRIINHLTARLDRFGNALDVICQSVSQIGGFQPVGIVWGLLRVTFMVFLDVLNTVEMTSTLLEELARALPSFSAYANIFKDSEIQLIRDPLVTLYREIILFGLEAVKILNPGFVRAAADGIWGSLQCKVQSLVKNTTEACRQVDRDAAVEHFAQTDSAIRTQLLENQRADEFRGDLRSALGIVQASTQPFSHMSFNDAPTSLLSARFIGRQDELSILKSFFTSDLGRGLRRLSIFGMYGVGKTQLVLQFAKQSFPQQYQMIFWVASNTVEKLNQGLPKVLNLVGHMDRNHPEQSARLVASRRWLEDYKSTPSKRGWLFIVDNVEKETISFLREHLPRSSTSGDIIFTTREKDVAEALSQSAVCEHKTIHLQTPSKQDAAKLLLRGSGLDNGSVSEESMSQAETLAGRLACLPLAVDNASAFMRQRHMSLDGLLELYDSEQKDEFISWQNELSTYECASIVRTFHLQLEELRRTSPAARDLLNVLSFYDIAGIPLTLIATKAEKSLSSLEAQSDSIEPRNSNRFRKLSLSIRSRKKENPIETISVTEKSITLTLRTLFASTRPLQEAILKLQSAALLEIQELDSTSTVHLHDLVQYMVQQDLLVRKKNEDFFKCAVALCCAAFECIYDKGVSTSWAACEPFIPHIQTLSRYCNAQKSRISRIDAANVAVARYFRARGRYSEAETLFQRALDESRDDFGEKDSRTLQAMQDVASVQRRQGKYQEAEALLRKVLEQQNSSLGSDAPATLHTAQILSSILMEAGKGKEAVKLSKLSMKRASKSLGGNHFDTLRIKQNLALLYERLGESDNAIELYDVVFKERRERLGPEHKDTQCTLQNLAVVHSRKRQFDRAEQLFSEALKWRQDNLGPTHYETLQTLQNLANVCFEKGELQRAEELYVLALSGWHSQLEPDHHETLQTLSNLAVLYERQGKFEQAEGLYGTALEGYEARLGRHDARTLRTVHNMAVLAERRERFAEAEQLYQRALKGREKALGKSHPDTGRTRERLAALGQRTR